MCAARVPESIFSRISEGRGNDYLENLRHELELKILTKGKAEKWKLKIGNRAYTGGKKGGGDSCIFFSLSPVKMFFETFLFRIFKWVQENLFVLC